MGRPPKGPPVYPLRPPMPEGMRATGAPMGLTMKDVGAEGKEVLERQALEIFTLMANAGKPFAASLAAILLSGIDWGVQLTKIDDPKNPVEKSI